jgi:hypothetical protein
LRALYKYTAAVASARQLRAEDFEYQATPPDHDEGIYLEKNDLAK